MFEFGSGIAVSSRFRLFAKRNLAQKGAGRSQRAAFGLSGNDSVALNEKFSLAHPPIVRHLSIAGPAST